MSTYACFACFACFTANESVSRLLHSCYYGNEPSGRVFDSLVALKGSTLAVGTTLDITNGNIPPYDPDIFLTPSLYHLEKGWSCRIPTTVPPGGLKPRGDASTTLVRLPVYRLHSVRSPTESVWNASIPAADGLLRPSDRDGPEIIGWRTLLVAPVGCHENSLGCCCQPVDVDPTSGQTGTEVLVLDLTPLLRAAPKEVRVGFRPEPAALEDVHATPLSSITGVDGKYPWSSFDVVKEDLWFARNASWIASTTCPNGSHPDARRDPGFRSVDEAVARRIHRDWAKPPSLALDWESQFFNAVHRAYTCPRIEFGDEWVDCVRPVPNDPVAHPEIFCENVPPLRWHRVRALGKHVQSAPSGLHVEIPPHDTPWAWPATSAELQKYSSSNPRHGGRIHNLTTAVDSSAAILLSRGLPRLVYSTKVEDGPREPAVLPIGRNGLLGHLGSPTIMLQSGVTGSTATTHPVFLELLATVPAVDSLPTDPYDIAGSPPLDDKVVFWGAWRSLSDAAGEEPMSRHGMGKASIPVPESAMSPWTLYPHHPFATEANKDNLSSVQPVKANASLQWEAWQWMVTHRAWGPAVDGMDLAKRLFTNSHIFPSYFELLGEAAAAEAGRMAHNCWRMHPKSS